MEPRFRRQVRRPDNIFEYVHREHVAASALLERLGSEPSASLRDELLFALERQLTVHAVAEEHTFYAALRVADETRFRVRRAVGEHAQIQVLLDRLAAAATDDASWPEMLQELRRVMEQHMVEESEIFEAARHVLTLEEARALARDMEAEERRLDSGMTMTAGDLQLAIAAGGR